MVDLAQLNAWSEQEIHDALLKCCGSPQWVAAMASSRPFESQTQLFAAADGLWFALPQSEWLAAFGHHPRIGETQLRAKFESTADWSAGEQAGVTQASEAVIQGLAQGNEAYYEKFGFVFLICATGKSAKEMLSALQERLLNDRVTELQNAAQEHSAITKIRLEKL
jgi:2-oxo-4-hydroxy-4-carboxy-5-ureidoimidazoline decarboxylase